MVTWITKINKEKLMKKIKVLACVLSMSAILGVSQTGFAKDDDKVLAEVAGQKLLVSTLEEQVKSLPPQMQAMMARDSNMKKQFVERWVQINILALEAKKAKLDQDKDIKAKIDENTNLILASEYVRKNIEPKLKVTDEEIQKFYDEHKTDFTVPETVKARHILLKVDSGADEKAWKDAEKKANDIKKKLAEGGDFAKLAQEFSDDPGSKARGGDLGFFPKGRMVPEFENAAFALKPGEISAPVKSTFGYHIIQTQEKKPSETKKLEDVKQQIGQRLEAQQLQNNVETTVNQLKGKYPVKINEAALAATDTGSAPSPMPMHGKDKK